MKLTKAKLKQIIKEELDKEEARENLLMLSNACNHQQAIADIKNFKYA